MVIIQFLTEFYTLFFVLLSAISALVAYRKTWHFSFRVLAIFIILYSVLDTAGNIMAFNNINNHFYYNLIHIALLMVVPYFFCFQLLRPFFKKIIRVYFIVFPLFVLINILWIQNFFTFLTYSYGLGGEFVILLTIGYFWQLHANEEGLNLFRDPVFWFSVAYLFYFAVTVPFFGMLTYLLQNVPQFTKLYYLSVYDITICVYNIFLTAGFLCMKTSAK
jgi:hypothetical protein